MSQIRCGFTRLPLSREELDGQNEGKKGRHCLVWAASTTNNSGFVQDFIADWLLSNSSCVCVYVCICVSVWAHSKLKVNQLLAWYVFRQWKLILLDSWSFLRIKLLTLTTNGEMFCSCARCASCFCTYLRVSFSAFFRDTTAESVSHWSFNNPVFFFMWCNAFLADLFLLTDKAALMLSYRHKMALSYPHLMSWLLYLLQCDVIKDVHV